MRLFFVRCLLTRPLRKCKALEAPDRIGIRAAEPTVGCSATPYPARTPENGTSIIYLS